VQDKTIIFVGEKQVGKSSLINKFLDEPVKDDMKETTALDYRYGTRLKDEKKQKVNIYELGGGRVLSSLLSAPLNQHSLLNTSVCIVLDLSLPGNTVDSLLFWLSCIREHLQKITDDILKQNPSSNIEEVMKARLQEKWQSNDDRSKVHPLLLPVVVVGSKFDIFAKQYEPIKKKQLCLALRYLCHDNGCDLVFASTKEKIPGQLFKAMISRQVFEQSLQVKLERDANQALNVYAASDSFLHIGEPEVTPLSFILSMSVGFKHERQSQFPAALAGNSRS
jgi:dynein light intermediate chain 2